MFNNKKNYKFLRDYSDIFEIPSSTSYEVINEIINIDSFVDMYILQEIVCNNDIHWSSQCFQLDMSEKGDKKLTWTSMWDYDLAFGMMAKLESTNLPGEYVTSLHAAENGTGTGTCNSWYLFLIHEDWFWDMVKEKWKLLIDIGVLYNSLHYIDEIKLMIKPYANINSLKWPFTIRLGENYGIRRFGTNLDLQANYLFSWLARRYNYLNTVFGDGTKLFNF